MTYVVARPRFPYLAAVVAARGITKWKLAADAGVRANRLSEIITGNGPDPSVEEQQRIAAVLGLDPSELFDEQAVL